MRSILYLLPDLRDHGHSRQASLLAAALPRDRFKLSICSLAGPGTFSEPLRRTGATIASAEFRRSSVWDEWLALRRLLQIDRPEVIHVWGLPPLRALWFATLFKRSLLPPLVISLNAAVLRKHQLAWWQRKLLGRARRIVTMSDAERSALSAAGLPGDKLRVIRPGVPEPDSNLDARAFRAQHEIPLEAPLLAAVGHMEQSDRAHDAIWAFEFMKYILPNLQLLLIGDGPNRVRLGSHFRSARQSDSGVRFLGSRPDADALVQLADVALIPHRRSGGTFSTLEAMAAGRPVVATRLPHLAEIIRDRETGVLVPPVDQPALARAVLRVLENKEWGEMMVHAAREQVQREFRAETMTAAFADLYEGLLS